MIFRLLSILLLATPSLTLPSLSPRQRCVPSNETCGCSSTSFSSWSWSVTDLYYHSSIVFSTPAHQIPNGMISFSLAHPAMPGVSLACSASSTQLQDFFYGNQYFSCTNGNVTDETATRATFRFDKATGRVDLNQTWTCTDVDPVYPYVSSLLFRGPDEWVEGRAVTDMRDIGIGSTSKRRDRPMPH